MPYPPIVHALGADDHGYFRPKVKDVDLLFATSTPFYISQTEALESTGHRVNDPGRATGDSFIHGSTMSMLRGSCQAVVSVEQQYISRSGSC